MPYSIDPGHPDCEGFAVVKDTDGSVMGCHRTRTQAERQVAALYASEPDLDDDDGELEEERAEGHTSTGAMIDEAAGRAYESVGIKTETPRFTVNRPAFDEAVAILARLRTVE